MHHALLKLAERTIERAFIAARSQTAPHTPAWQFLAAAGVRCYSFGMPNHYATLIRDIPDFPQPGITFRDITPLLSSAMAFREAISDLATPFRDERIDQVVAIEARGYLLGAPLALELGAGFVPVRKVGKLPFKTFKAEYALEYGEASIEMHTDALLREHRVLLVDDVLATGGTMEATINLVKQSGAQVAGIAVLIELAGLNGRSKLQGHRCTSLIRY